MNKDYEQILNIDENIKYSNQFYKIMVESLGEEIFVTDGEGKCIFCNPASVKAIGLFFHPTEVHRWDPHAEVPYH